MTNIVVNKWHICGQLDVKSISEQDLMVFSCILNERFYYHQGQVQNMVLSPLQKENIKSREQHGQAYSTSSTVVPL